MIGVYGGTFDPVHFGHLRTAFEVKQAFGLDELRLLPCSQPAHRQQPVASVQCRLQMLKLAVQEEPELVVDSREIDRGGVSYMVDTLQSLRQEIGTEPLLLFMGADAFLGLENWSRWQQLFDYAHVIVMTRPKMANLGLSPFFQQRQTVKQAGLKTEPYGRLFFQNVTQLDISASSIRGLIKEKSSPRYLLPDNVLSFIRQHHLYT